MTVTELNRGADLRKMHSMKSCEFSFVWGKMRTAAWETAFQIAQRNCSTGAEGTVRIQVILEKWGYRPSHVFCRFLRS